MTTTAQKCGAAAAGNELSARAAEEVFRAGGNSVDTALAAQAAVMVSMPQSAGFGGDALAIVRDGVSIVGVNGTGESASHWPTATLDTVGASIAVPGAVAAIFDMHRRCGAAPIEVVLGPALRLAEQGFTVDHHLMAAIDAQRERMQAVSPAAPLLTLAEGDEWRQPELASLIADLITDGPDAFYTGPRAEVIAARVQEVGGGLSAADLGRHSTVIREPVSVPWNGGTVWVQPPVSQGVLLAMALKWLDERFDSYTPTQLDHIMVELTSSCFAHRSDCALGEQLLGRELDVSVDRATNRPGPRSYLHTAGVTTADQNGMIVSSLISVFDDFGSAVWVPEVGIFLNNRSDGFTDGANSPAPSKRPIHTLAPILLRDAEGRFTGLATPGADGQVQTLLQILVAHRRGAALEDSVKARRWRSEDAKLLLEQEHSMDGALAAYGHHVVERTAGDDVFGAVVVAGIRNERPYSIADWRRQTAAIHYE